MNDTLILHLQSSLIPTTTIPVSSGTFVLGRSSACDLVVKDATVSRRHAEITVTNGRVTIRDLDSSNGTYVDERRVSKCIVAQGARIRFGGVTVTVKSGKQDIEEPDSEEQTDKIDDEPRGVEVQNARRRLSKAQRRVFDLLLRGLSEKQIAERQYRSPRTVHNHVQEIYRTLDVHSAKDLLVRFL